MDARIRQCWDTLFRLNRALGVETHRMFGLGAGAEAIALAERELGFALPEEIKAGCRLYNGVREYWPAAGWGYHFAGVELIPLWLENYRREAAQCPPFRCGAGVQPPRFGPQLIPFASGMDNTVYCLDYNPGAGGKPGQVSAVCFDDASVQAAAGSYLEFLEQDIRSREADIERMQAGSDTHEKASNEAGCLGCLGLIALIVPGGVLALVAIAMWRLLRLLLPRLLRLLLPRLLRNRLEDRMRPWCKKIGVPGLIPPPPPAPKIRIEAAPGSVTALWYEIEDLNRARGENVKWLFLAGAGAAQLAALESSLGFPLPEDMRELFAACAACHSSWNGEKEFSGFDTEQIPYVMETMRDTLDAGYKLRLYAGTRFPEPGAKLIPFGGGAAWRHIDFNVSALCYDLDPGEGGTAGQIVLVDLENHACRVVAPSLKAWLEEGILKLKTRAQHEPE